jgi:small subunit ribosomal protein S14
MAKVSVVNRNNRRRISVQKYAERRAQLKKIWLNPMLPAKEKEGAFELLQKMPRDTAPTRVRNRCALTGRPRGGYIVVSAFRVLCCVK